VNAIRESGLTKHGEIREMLKTSLDLGHDDANALGLAYKRTLEAPQTASHDVLDDLYAGSKAELRPIHERLMTEIAGLGACEIAPKNGCVSLRRKMCQFKVFVSGVNEVDRELMEWVRQAYDSAG
jgi:hypothetical protein